MSQGPRSPPGRRALRSRRGRRARSRPRWSEDALHAGRDGLGGVCANAADGVELGEGDIGLAPGRGEHGEALHREVLGGRESAVVVPVVDDDVFGDEVDGAMGLEDARFPFADARSLAVEEAVAPHPHGPFRERQVVVHRRTSWANSSALSFPLQREQSSSPSRKTSSMPTWKASAPAASASSSIRSKTTACTWGWSGQ